MRDLSRRDVLAGATALGAVALAGCVAENDDDETDDPDNTSDPDNAESSDNGDDTGSEPESASEPELELLETELTTASADCGSGDLVEATVTDGDLTLEGKLPASNPCHEAALDRATLEDGALSVAVRAAETTGEDETCMSCLGVVEYEGTLSFSADLTDLSTFESVTVEHGGTSGETHTIEEAGVVNGQVSRSGDRSEGESDGGRVENTVLADSVVTTDRSCTGNIPPSGDPERVEASDRTEFTQTGSTVTVQGSLTASTPCHEAYVESVNYNDGELSLVVGAESNLDPGELCTECLADIQYEATVELAEGVSVDGVSVTHIEAAG
jgi:hypothetical protein